MAVSLEKLRADSAREREQLQNELAAVRKAAAVDRAAILERARAEAHAGMLRGISDVSAGVLPAGVIKEGLDAGMSAEQLELLAEL